MREMRRQKSPASPPTNRLPTMMALQATKSGGISDLTNNQRSPMKPILRYQSQLLFRRSYKPKRILRIRPTGKVNLVFRPVHRFGVKPVLGPE
jgi:hypothetical protein